MLLVSYLVALSLVCLTNLYIAYTDIWIPRPLWYGEQVQIKRVSPDGKFEATVVYLDGLTYGIQFVRLRDLRNPLIPFAQKIAISTLEEVHDLEWKSSNELHIVASPEENEGHTMQDLFEMYETSCYGIHIDYTIESLPTTY